jgi:peptidoglycan hydrolase-like protein with peptidoglycan-binding domain
MKRSLTEELERIHTITYGKQVIEQEGFLDKILKGVGLKDKVDEPNKADLVSDDVNDFFKTIEDAAKSGGLTQQQRGSMTFQKSVESMQIGLMLLGYQLPKFGVDGLFGPETAAAVKKFTEENLEKKEPVNEATLDSPIGDTKLNSPFGPRWGRMHAGADLSASSGTQIKSPLDGEVIDAETRNDACGGTIYIKHADNIKTRYCHCKQINVSKGEIVKKGQVIGLTGGASGDPGRGRSDGAHLHFEVYKDGKVVDPMPYIGSQVSDNFTSDTEPIVSASPEMLNKLIELLKDKGVSSEDLGKLVDKVNLEGLVDQNFYAKLLENLGAPVSEENLKFLYAWRQSEGKAGKFNPFNTTWDLPGSTNFNSVGVKNYQTLGDGMVATIKTLKNGRYNCIVDGLRNDIGADNIAKCESLKTWGTGDLVGKVVASYNAGSNPKIKELA